MKNRFKIVVIGFVLFGLNTGFAQQKTGMVILSGKLKNFSNQVDIEDLSEFQYLLPPKGERIIIPGKDASFKISFPVKAANYFRLGRNTLYLSPGDNMEVVIDKNNPRNASFKGKGAEANNYLRNTPFPKGGSFLEAGKLVKDTPEATIAAVEASAETRRKELMFATGLTAEFRRLETARIKADLINSLLSGEDYSSMILKLKAHDAEIYALRYKEAIKSKVMTYGRNFVDASLMKMTVYRDIANDLINDSTDIKLAQPIKDWYKAEELVGEMEKAKNKSELAKFKERIAQIKTVLYKKAANQMLQQLLSFGKGDEALDFTARDLNGLPVKLSSLKGKVIYVDLWATWCGPCMHEMPYFEKLKVEYKDNPNIVFVSLSLDDDAEVWKKSVESRKADGQQWLIDRNKLQAYNIVGIPRILLIDKNFKVADMDAPAPSSADALKAIKQLL
ncbi:hypothetical protein DBR11_12595 [Pedobacter sp. HMWF019]|uniref:TlpA family protein disulfide reductase n=1 Tax=Pedobacter sp. HMWF019 TaxID=2056856 RepID=UPI000D34E024|nr:TlpA disulfide reductase family protein [Pedobacter sp. HMWF019]PTS99338.1 hypothetical protein DBR11_12595 [Pedobacter sp. HMWF019]